MPWINGTLQTCDMMTGQGFDVGFFGTFGMAWLGVVIIFFIVALARRWIGEEMGVAFFPIGAWVLAYIAYLATVTITCSPKWALLLGIIGAAVGGFLLGQFFDVGDG